jgi:hypothetical protein
MDTQTFDLSFTWKKPAIGYTWEDCEAISQNVYAGEIKVPPPPYLVEQDYAQEMGTYQPFEDSTIFTSFADLKPAADVFAQWASSYGTLLDGEILGAPSMMAYLIVLPNECIEPKKPISNAGMIRPTKDGRKGYAYLSESLQFWRNEHKELSFAFLLWELANLKDTENLSKIVEWNEMRTGASVYKIEKDQLFSPDMKKIRGSYNDYFAKHGIREEPIFEDIYFNPWVSKICRYPDVIKPALSYVHLCINNKLRKYPLNFVTQINEQGKFFNVLQPTSLLSCMWYQFLQVVRGDVKLRRCDVCGKWEDMKTHRDSWHRHRSCANVQRVARSRRKGKEMRQE